MGKKFINPIPFGGAPLNADRLIDVLGVEMWSSIESIPISIQSGYSVGVANGDFGFVMTGGAISGAGPYSVAAGIVYLNGEYMSFPAISGLISGTTYYIQKNASNPIITQKTFATGSLANLITENQAVILTSAPGTGHYVSFTPNLNNIRTFRSLITLPSDLAAYVASAIVGKANVAQGAWSSAITLINGWTGTVKYRIDTMGYCHVQGSLSATTASAIQVASAGALPNPAGGFGNVVFSVPGRSANVQGVITISTTGAMQVDAYGAADGFYLSTIQYPTT